MAFNADRKRLAAGVQTRLGEPATYRPLAGGSIETRVVVRRARVQEGEIGQPRTTITVFRVDNEWDIDVTRTGDTIELGDGTAYTGGDTFKVAGGTNAKDEFKTILHVTPN